MDKTEVERLFQICDSEGKGYLTEQDLKKVCPELDDQDVSFIFTQLDTDGSGHIEKNEFVVGFESAVMNGEKHGRSGMQRRVSIRSGSSGRPAPLVKRRQKFRQEEEIFDSDAETSNRPNLLAPFEDEIQSESDTNVGIDFAMPCQDEVLMLYQQLQSAGMPQLLKKYEKVVGSFYKELKEKKHENEKLQHVYESEREMYNRRMEEVESEIDEQLQIAQNKAREEERERLNREKEEMREKLESEMREMRENIARLQKMERVLEQEGEKLSQEKKLQEKLREVNDENDELRKGLAENHVELAMIKSELAHIRSDYEHKESELVRHKEHFGKSAGEAENMQRQLQLLFDANNKLHETNESLRFALDNRAAVLRQFNLRTPSPSIYRDSPVGSLQSQSPLAGNLYSQTSQSNLGSYGMDDDGDSGLTMDGGSNNSSDTDVKATTPAEKALVGLNEANGPAERTFRIVMCGDAAVGKSSLVFRLVKNEFSSGLPSTLGVDFHVKTVNVDGHNVALQLWDTAGQERFRSLCKSYFRRADGAILVYDVTSEHSFLRVRDWIDTIKESVERNIPIIMVGNKSDLRSGNDGVPKSDGAAVAASLGVLFVETSAKNGHNVDQTILQLARELLAIEDIEVRASGVILSPKPKQNTGCFSRCKS